MLLIRIPLLMGIYSSLLLNLTHFIVVKAHSVEIRSCITPVGNLRIFVEHWHGPNGNEDPNPAVFDDPNDAGTMVIRDDTDGVGSEVELLPIAVANGIENSATDLPGCVEGGTKLENSCGNPIGDWVYYEFPTQCNKLVKYTFLIGTTFVLKDGCSDLPLLPTTIEGTFYDTTPPILFLNGEECVDGTVIQVVTSGPSVTTAIATYTTSANDDCDKIPTVTVSHASGSTFNLGDTSVTLTGTDNQGRSDTCTFIVRVELGTEKPSITPSSVPSQQPTTEPTLVPSGTPSQLPSRKPSSRPSYAPSVLPTLYPSSRPSSLPSSLPSWKPSHEPSYEPTAVPSFTPSYAPSVSPTLYPSIRPSSSPSSLPSWKPSHQPTAVPSFTPSIRPSDTASVVPSSKPSISPSILPSLKPSSFPTYLPSKDPSEHPSLQPNLNPSSRPSSTPSILPSFDPCFDASSGTFGNTTGNRNMLIIPYLYEIAIETSVMDDMGETFLNVVKDTEQNLLQILVRSLFTECGEEDSGARWLRSKVQVLDTNTTAGDENSGNSTSTHDIIGISSKPWDIADREALTVKEGSSADKCYVMNGGISIYLSSASNDTSPMRTLVLNSIIDMMEEGDLDSSHPAVVYVSSMELDTVIQEDSVIDKEVGETGDPIEQIQVSGVNMVPVSIGAAVGGFFFLFVVFYRYRYHVEQRRVESMKGTEETRTSTNLSNFVEVPLPVR